MSHPSRAVFDVADHDGQILQRSWPDHCFEFLQRRQMVRRQVPEQELVGLRIGVGPFYDDPAQLLLPPLHSRVPDVPDPGRLLHRVRAGVPEAQQGVVAAVDQKGRSHPNGTREKP